MKPDGSLSCTQDPTIELCPAPFESSSYSHTPMLLHVLFLVLYPRLRPPCQISHLGLATKMFHAQRISPTAVKI